jgi:transitional endoplasmic reticulum ATPase
VNLLQFAAAGFATAELDTEDEPIISWRSFLPPPLRRAGRVGSLAETRFFAKYRYTWNNTHFILYSVIVGFNLMQYVLTEPRPGESTRSKSGPTDALVAAIGKWILADEDLIYVYDGFWAASRPLWEQVQKASWDKVILDQKMKDELKKVSTKFFDSKDVYDEYGVPWRRGLIFHGPVGNGKTISIKALMHTLYEHEPKIPSLYVKAAPQTYHIRAVFQFARSMAPCLLVIEDIETVVTPVTRSYFFNEVDGLENNDGILMLATTNYRAYTTQGP